MHCILLCVFFVFLFNFIIIIIIIVIIIIIIIIIIISLFNVAKRFIVYLHTWASAMNPAPPYIFFIMQIMQATEKLYSLYSLYKPRALHPSRYLAIVILLFLLSRRCHSVVILLFCYSKTWMPRDTIWC